MREQSKASKASQAIVASKASKASQASIASKASKSNQIRNDSPCLCDEKRWESAKQNATSSTHNDSPCLRDEEPICRIQLCQSNTHNDSPCLRDEKRWESAMERSTLCAVVPDPCRFQRAPCTLSDPQSPAVDIFALADPVRRLTARNTQKIAAPGRQPRNPSNDCAIRQSQSDTD